MCFSTGKQSIIILAKSKRHYFKSRKHVSVPVPSGLFFMSSYSFFSHHTFLTFNRCSNNSPQQTLKYITVKNESVDDVRKSSVITTCCIALWSQEPNILQQYPTLFYWVFSPFNIKLWTFYTQLEECWTWPPLAYCRLPKACWVLIAFIFNRGWRAQRLSSSS